MSRVIINVCLAIFDVAKKCKVILAWSAHVHGRSIQDIFRWENPVTERVYDDIIVYNMSYKYVGTNDKLKSLE